MPIDDRWQHLLLGMAIGFVLGYFTRLIQDVKEEVHDVKEELDEVKDEIEHDVIPRLNKDEKGFMRYPWIANIAVFLTVGLTVYAAFVSQKASNDSQNSQDRVEIVAYCNLKITGEALTALNERSTYTKRNLDATIAERTDFAKFFNLLLHQPPYSSDEQLKFAHDYQRSLNLFVTLSGKTKNKVVSYPFPTKADLHDCVVDGQ